MKRIAILGMITALGTLLAVAPGAAPASTPGVVVGNITCTGTIPGPTKIVGNVVVPDGASCVLGLVPDPSISCCILTDNSVWVTGNVTVGHGSNLTVGLNSTIVGNLQADHCGFVELVSEGAEVVQGNVQISHCNGGSHTGDPAFESTATGSRIGGNLECHDNTGPCILEGAFVHGNVQVTNNVSPGSPSMIDDNTVQGDVQVTNNVSTGVPSVIAANSIAGNLQCQGNVPAIMAYGNRAKQRQGQCQN
jgi:hypothetical protein